ncbi:MAG: four helix bundle protein [Candidatus Peribacteraceae bacterium]|nr:four helix bundle protein [Candidatus Peribacteraceae bacterium]
MAHERPYEKLVVWKEAHLLCLQIYELTKKLPADERFRLVSQLCRAAYSVPMNIAEGNMKHSKREKYHFMETAIGSLEELHYQCRLVHDLHYISFEDFSSIDQHIHRVSFLLTRLSSSLL